MLEDDYDVAIEEPSGPFCTVCGCELERELCGDCDGTGWREYEDDLEFEDPLWYQPGDQERCSECAGKGGWWFCPNRAAHTAVPA